MKMEHPQGSLDSSLALNNVMIAPNPEWKNLILLYAFSVHLNQQFLQIKCVSGLAKKLFYMQIPCPNFEILNL